ncbi:MAG TPA: glycosyltransferase [Gemmataceae bacterium]|nr:glycosyltransferase [Gemmataceae bacterium]
MRVTLLNLFARYGGAETCVRNLLRGLLDRGHTVRLLVGRRGTAPSLPEEHVALLPRFYPEVVLQLVLSRLGGLTETTLLLPLWLASRHPDFTEADVVHGHILNGSYWNLWALPLLARKTPIVLTLHDMWLMTGGCDHSEACQRWRDRCGACPMMQRPWRRRNSVGWRDLTRLNLAIKRRVFRCVPVDRLVVVSPSRWLASLAADSCLGRFRIEVIPNGVDLDAFAPGDQAEARRALGLPAAGKLFLAVAGNWGNPHKGGELLLPLAQALAADGVGRLVVAGRIEESLADRLRAAAALVIPEVHDPARLRRLFIAADNSLLLSRNENFPYVVSESLACGRPVIARAVGGVREMIADGVTGYCLPAAAGVAEFVAAARRWASLTPADVQAQRQAARRWAEDRFALRKMVESYEGVYAGLVAQRNDKVPTTLPRPRQAA